MKLKEKGFVAREVIKRWKERFQRGERKIGFQLMAEERKPAISEMLKNSKDLPHFCLLLWNCTFLKDTCKVRGAGENVWVGVMMCHQLLLVLMDVYLLYVQFYLQDKQNTTYSSILGKREQCFICHVDPPRCCSNNVEGFHKWFPINLLSLRSHVYIKCKCHALHAAPLPHKSCAARELFFRPFFFCF